MSWQHFRRAIVRTPCRNLIHGQTSSKAADLGPPSPVCYELALQQHKKYIQVLKRCGLDVTVLPAADAFPDSCFVEDVAICTPAGIIYSRPGAESRRGEVAQMQHDLENYNSDISHIALNFEREDQIDPPGTVDGGDVMMVGNRNHNGATSDTTTHAFIGLSDRTNEDGASQLARILQDHHNIKSTLIPIPEMLHLKSGMTAISENTCIATGPFVELATKHNLKSIGIENPNLTPLANCIVINNRLIYPEGYWKEELESFSFQECIPVDTSEFQKLDGALTCLSLRF
jgi:dimethylargininase